jgi:hypothetical protein
MIRPVNFAFNAETAVNNSFQTETKDASVQTKALQEFDAFVNKLQAAGIDVTVVQDTPEPHTPDSIFPNNWISFHDDDSIMLYPMFAQNRRLERKQSVIDAVAQKFNVTHTRDLTDYEHNNVFLEGTGSMVLDRENKIVYACLSPRTHKKLLDKFAEVFNYKTVAFTSVDAQGSPIYHTNVMMCVADKFVVICLDTIKDETERKQVTDSIQSTGKEIITITADQMNNFAGNMLQVQNKDGLKFLVMSSQAYNSLTSEQIQSIEKYCPILHSDISTIETNGGGSARCMMAEVFVSIR